MIEQIWCVCDISITKNREFSFQLLSKAAEIKDENSEVFGIAFGNEQIDSIQNWFQYGCNNIIVNKTLFPKCAEDYINVLEAMVHKYNPNIMIFPATDIGKQIAASLSVRMETGLTAECIDIERTDDGIIFTRTAMNSSIMAQIKCINSSVQMCSARKNVFAVTKNEEVVRGKIYEFYDEVSVTEIDNHERLLECVKDETVKKIDTLSARVVFCVGRGITKQTFEILKKIAKKYNAEVVGTRAAVECGLVERGYQVGQSGESISPDIYIGFGVSGASQHMVGIRNANIIIAVNNDPDAPIFKYADYCLHDNAEEILQAMELF